MKQKSSVLEGAEESEGQWDWPAAGGSRGSPVRPWSGASRGRRQCGSRHVCAPRARSRAESVAAVRAPSAADLGPRTHNIHTLSCSSHGTQQSLREPAARSHPQHSVCSCPKPSSSQAQQACEVVSSTWEGSHAASLRFPPEIYRSLIQVMKEIVRN